jgi:hypothetical protein
MEVHPVALMPNTSPLGVASGSTANAAIGQIAAMNTATSMSCRKCRVDTTYATNSSFARKPNIAVERRLALRWRAEQHDPDTIERDTREHQGSQVVELPEELGANRHDEERRERTDQRSVRDPVVSRPSKGGGKESEERARHQRQASMPHRYTTHRYTTHRYTTPSPPEQQLQHDRGDRQPPEGDEDARCPRSLDERRTERAAGDNARHASAPNVSAPSARRRGGTSALVPGRPG